MHINFRQDVKCVANTLFASKEGGYILAFWKSELGFDDRKFSIPLVLPPVSLIRFFLKLLTGNGIKFLVDRLFSVKQPEEGFFIYFALQSIKRNKIFVYSPQLFKELGNVPAGLPLFNDYNKMFEKVNRTRLKNKIQDVLIFPKGGVTYPIIK